MRTADEPTPPVKGSWRGPVLGFRKQIRAVHDRFDGRISGERGCDGTDPHAFGAPVQSKGADKHRHGALAAL